MVHVREGPRVRRALGALLFAAGLFLIEADSEGEVLSAGPSAPAAVQPTYRGAGARCDSVEFIIAADGLARRVSAAADRGLSGPVGVSLVAFLRAEGNGICFANVADRVFRSDATAGASCDAASGPARCTSAGGAGSTYGVAPDADQMCHRSW